MERTGDETRRRKATREKTTRRALLAAGAAAVASQALPARAATGDPMILGHENRAGRPTVLRASSGLINAGGVLLSLKNSTDAPTLSVENPCGCDGWGVRILTGEAIGLEVESEDVALQVSGRARLSRSGVATIPAGERRVRVPVENLLQESMVLATIQGGPPLGLAALAEGDSVVLRLSKPAPEGGVLVAWLVLN